MNTPLIIVTNDDGIESPGLKAAVAAVMELGEIIVIAPTTQQTSMGRALCGDNEDRLHEIEYEVNSKTLPAYHADCSPAKLLMHGLQVLFPDRRPDLVVSGINYGENLGTNIGLSGTCGVAFQAGANDIPSLAVSIETEIDNHLTHVALDWTASKHFTGLFAEKMLGAELPDDVDIINLNIPANASPDTEWKITRQSRQPFFNSRIANADSDSTIGDGKCTIEFDHERVEPDSDIQATTLDHFVSVTPLSIDNTSRVELASIFNKTR